MNKRFEVVDCPQYISKDTGISIGDIITSEDIERINEEMKELQAYLNPYVNSTFPSFWKWDERVYDQWLNAIELHEITDGEDKEKESE